MYTVITVARDVVMDEWGNDTLSLPYITDDDLILFETREQAFNSALKSSEEEVISLTEGLDDDDLKSFNIPEDLAYEDMLQVKVMCYIPEDELDDEADSYVVTARIIREIK